MSLVKCDLELFSRKPHHHGNLPHRGYTVISRGTIAIPTLGEAVSEAGECPDGWGSPSP